MGLDFNKLVHDPVKVLHVMTGERRTVVGLASMNDELFVIRSEQSYITVYDKKSNFTKVSEIKVSGLMNPWDIIACQHNTCLYISDCVQCVIYRVDLNNRFVCVCVCMCVCVCVCVSARVYNVHIK